MTLSQRGFYCSMTLSQREFTVQWLCHKENCSPMTSSLREFTIQWHGHKGSLHTVQCLGHKENLQSNDAVTKIVFSPIALSQR